MGIAVYLYDSEEDIPWIDSNGNTLKYLIIYRKCQKDVHRNEIPGHI